MRVTIGLAQVYPKLGDVPANLEKHLAYIDQAAEGQVDLLVFPEMSLAGYQIKSLVSEVAIRTEEDDPTFAAMLQASHKLDIMFGFARRDQHHRFYIVCAYLSGGQCLHLHHKVHLPTYPPFEDQRFFANGESVRAFDTRFGRVGMLICEDFWHMSLPYLLWMDGADILLFQSASLTQGLDTQQRHGGIRKVEQIQQAYGSTFTNFVVHCNRVGYEDGKNFWGGSSIVDPTGEFLLRGPYYEETLLTQTIDLHQLARVRSQLPLLRDERPQLIQRELGRILRNKEHRIG